MSLARYQSMNEDIMKLMASHDDAQLRELLQSVHDDADEHVMTKEVLRRTRIGHTLTKLKKATAHDDIRKLCDTTIKLWKQQVGVKADGAGARKKAAKVAAGGATKFDDNSDDGSDQPESGKRRPGAAEAHDDEKEDAAADEEMGDGDEEEADEEEEAQPGGDGLVDGKRRELSSEVTGVRVRDKMIKRFMDSLRPAVDRDEYRHFGRLAIEVERELNRAFPLSGASRAQYMKRGGDLYFNLKNAENPELNERLLTGQLSPGDLVRMDNAQLASDKMKQKRQEKLQWQIEESRSDNNKSAAMTDEYKCGRCKSRKCTYYQQQTRGADEPMTTFITCNNCGNRWKN